MCIRCPALRTVIAHTPGNSCDFAVKLPSSWRNCLAAAQLLQYQNRRPKSQEGGRRSLLRRPLYLPARVSWARAVDHSITLAVAMNSTKYPHLSYDLLGDDKMRHLCGV
jgi:hypothetical protein